MSFKIDFDELPYDLFKLLELPEDCSTKDVKKAYRKAVIKYHPDKNPNINDEFFSWISLANKILGNSEHRELYLEWKNWTDDHYRLKKSRVEVKVPTDKTFQQLEQELNSKHGYTPNDNVLDKNTMGQLIQKVNKERSNVIIPKERIGDINNAMDELKLNTNKLQERNQGIIEYTGEVSTLSTFSGYGSLDDYGKLYGENEKIATDKITTFNEAFNLSPYQQYVPDKLSLEDKIKQYKKETEKINKEVNKKIEKMTEHRLKDINFVK